LDTKKGNNTAVETRTSHVLHQEKNRGALTWQEGRVVRMRQGLSEAHEAPLEFHGQDQPETRARLALLEAHLLAEVHGIGPLAEDDTELDHGVKNRILDKLARLDD